jgi:tetratricopeptide (TPR) repeat protein
MRCTTLVYTGTAARPTVAGMRGAIGEDDVEELGATALTDEAHSQAAATLLGWAEEPHAQDAVPPAALLNAAAWHLQSAGMPEQVLDLHRRAVAAPGQVPPDARCYLHGALLTAGRIDEAQELAEEIRRSAPMDTDVYLFVAENYELAGNLEQAHRWLTMGAERIERTDREDLPADGFGVFTLLRARRRVRDGLGQPVDALDDLVPPVQPLTEG